MIFKLPVDECCPSSSWRGMNIYIYTVWQLCNETKVIETEAKDLSTICILFKVHPFYIDTASGTI